MISNDPLTAAAFAILKTRHDRDLIEKLTLVQGYSQLLALQPNNATFQGRLRTATEELRKLVDRVVEDEILIEADRVPSAHGKSKVLLSS
jgi:hypothetical protein